MRQINEDIKQGRFRQVYLLHGEERYLRRQYREKLRKALCPEGDSMNVHFYEGKNLPLEDVISTAETMPFFSDRRVIFLSDSGLFKSGGEKLAEYLAAPSETVCFVFTESEVDKRCKLYKTVQAKGYAAELTVQDEKTLLRWAAGILNKEGLRVTEETLLLFLEKTGRDMENIQMELEKLICYCSGRTAVTAQDVEAICTVHVSNRIFEMIDAVSAKQPKQALELYYDLLALKEPPLRILFLIARQCNLLLQVKELASKGFDSRAIASQMALHPFVAGKCVKLAARFESGALRRAVEKCVEAEEAVKTGRLDEKVSVEILILSVL